MNFILIYILTIILMTVAQMSVGALWYSKLLFGNTYIELAEIDKEKAFPKCSIILQLITSIIKSILIYYVVSRLYIILPASFFMLTISMLLLIVAYKFDSLIWSKRSSKTNKLFILNIGEESISYLLTVLIALGSINYI